MSAPNGLRTTRSQTVRKPNARTCGWDCEPALHCLQMVRTLFAANRNLSVFCVNTKRTGSTRCPFHAPGILCLPQVREKLINGPSNTCRMWMVQRLSGALVYTRFNMPYFCGSSLLRLIYIFSRVVSKILFFNAKKKKRKKERSMLEG